MNRRGLALLLAALVCLSAFAGCNRKGPDATPSQSAGSPITGGKQIDNANAKSIILEQKGNDTVVTLSFVLGSKVAGVDEAASDGVPSYRITTLNSPARVVLAFDALEYWDYDRALNVPENSLFHSVFKQLRSGDNRFEMYFQLKDDATVKAKENKDKLVLTFTKRKTEPAEHYNVFVQSPTLLAEGSLGADSGLSPTLCADLENTALISKPFATEAEAQAFKSELVTKHGDVLSADMLGVVTLTGNALPEFDHDVKPGITGKKVISKGGNEQSLPVAMPDGLYLCSSPDGKLSLFSKQIGGDQPASADDTIIEVEELWLLDNEGKFKRLSEIEFATIEQAAFSPDGKKLAILERTTDTAYLYIFDMETNSLQNLGDEGFGTSTAAFVWDSLGTALYAITGTDKLQLLKYDFTIPDETARITAVEDKEAASGDLGFSNGDLYFANMDTEEVANVFKIKPEGGLRSQFATGGSFRISPDEKTMAILETTSTVEEETNQNTILKLKDMATGKETIVIKNAYIVSYDWDPSGTLYFALGFDNNESNPYPYRLMRYNMKNSQTEEICDMIMSDFSVSPESGKLYLPYISSSETENVRSTYLLDLTQEVPK